MNSVLITFEDGMNLTVNSRFTIPKLRRTYIIGKFAPNVFYNSKVAKLTITSNLNLPRTTTV